jgi:two-component sensor histidine kinase
VEQIDLDVSQAIPLGLIINEAITNSIKYAFNKPGGKITIKLLEISGSYLLKIEDNGVGLPKNFNVNDRTKSLGMSLINGLTREIAGHFDIFGDNGTSISILFPPYEVLYNPSESGGNH